MTTRNLLGRARPYWRVYLVALIGGIIAYIGSYAISPTYASTTKVLIRGRDTTLLTSTGQNLSGQPGVIDSTLATALGETQSALVSSSDVSQQVVDRLHLDAPKPEETGIVHSIKSGLAGTIKRTKAYLTHGFYAEPNDREAAIEAVQKGLTATPLKDSYVLEIKGTADTAQGAANVTNTAADVLVGMSASRYQDEANRNRDFLGGQVTRTETAVQDASTAKRDYQERNGVTEITSSLADGSTSRTKVEDDLRAAGVDLSAQSAQLDVVNGQIASTSPTVDGQSSISTGRSETAIKTSEQNATYQSLLLDRNRLQGAIAATKARQATLKGILDGDPASARSAEQAGLTQLDQRLTAAEKTYQDVNTQYQAAILTAEHNNIEITRVGSAPVPTFPESPVRYNYLFLGLLCGALAGAGLTWLRRSGAGGPEGEWDDADTDMMGVDELVGLDNAPPSRSVTSATDEIIDLSRSGAPVKVGGRATNGDAAPARTQVGRFEIFRPDATEGP